MATEGEWRTITRRKLSPTNSNPAPPPQIQPFKPFHTQPSFADMVRRSSSSPPISTKPKPISSSLSSKTPTSPAIYISPHSHAQLRFPPSSRYVEWKGRCFQCCRMGHNAAHCRNPKRCGKCWGQGHVGSRCSSVQEKGHEHRAKLEPSFAELLESPIISKPMPEDWPPKNLVFVDRNDEYYQELAKLEGAVIMHNSNKEMDLTIEQVAQYAVRSNLVKVEDISISVMSKARHVIMLPKGLAPDKFIKAIPLDIWREGFSFYQWSPRDDATLSMPHFKVLIDLVGIPLDLFREKEVIRATSSMGIFLGTVSQPVESDIAIWTVAVATSSLSLIPYQIGYMVGGLEIPVDVIPKTWKHCPLYKVSEVAQLKDRYKPIILDIPSAPSSLKELVLLTDGEFLHISRSVLLYLCRDKDPMQLPKEVREAVLGPAMAEEQVAQVPTATIDPDTQNSYQAVTENLKSAVIEEGEPELNLSLDIVPNTYEAGQSPQNSNSSGNSQREQGPQLIMGDSSRMGCNSQSNPTVLKDKIISELTKNPPKILQRNKGRIEVGDSSKSRRSTTRVVTIYSPPKLRHSTLNKRKAQEKARNIRPKTRKRASRQARIIKEADGLVDVQINYEHCYNLENVLGFQPLQVQQALFLDNEDRADVLIEERNGDKEEEQPESGLNGETRLEEKDRDNGEGMPLAGPKGLTRTAGMEAGSVFELEASSGGWQGSGHEHLTDFDPDSEDELSSGSD